MAHRLPTHLNSIIPPPAEQVQQRRPWQGTLTLTFMNTTQGACQDVFVTAAETDGERCAQRGPGCYGRSLTQSASIAVWTSGQGAWLCISMHAALRTTT